MATGKKKNTLTTRSGPSRGTVVGVVAVVLFAALVGVGIYFVKRPVAAEDVAIPANSSATGTTVGNPAAKATIDVYQDFGCPVCKVFEQASGPTIDKLVSDGQAKVVYHPVAILDRFSPDKYSSRSSAASGCAADSNVFVPFLKLLYENQPEEGSAGLPADRLIALGQQAGAGPGFADCVNSDRYEAWTAGVTDQASKDGLQGTPTVKVNGKEIPQKTGDAISAAVTAAQG